MASSTDSIIRLTNAETNQASFRLLSPEQPVDSSKDLSITFDFYSYGGNGGDGLSFFILDGAVGEVKTVGGFGGSLGYANRNDNGVITPGIAGGYVGIGFDEFGNFSTGTEGRVGGAAEAGLGLGADSIAIRGGFSVVDAESYKYLTGVGGLTDATGLPISIDNTVPNDLDRNNAKRSARVDLTPAGLLSVKVDFNNDGDFDDAGETNALLQNIDVKTANDGNLPTTLRFGFAAATGNSTNIHEIGNFEARSGGVLLTTTSQGQIVGGGTGSSADKLIGGDRNDQIIGGSSDTLTGGKGGDRFIFSGIDRSTALKQSTLRSRARITDFNVNQGDRIQLDFDNQLTTPNLPKRLFNAGEEKGSLRKAAKAAYADKSFTKRGNQKLKPGEAVLFTQGSRTYISVNDNKAPFSPGNDLLVDVTNIKLKGGDSGLGTLKVGNYFV